MSTRGRNKFNPVKLNWNETLLNCQHTGCDAHINSNKISGLCNAHEKHQHDLLFRLIDAASKNITVPKHAKIIDQFVQWAKTRGYDLTPLFSALSFTILGNIPDVSTLAGEIKHVGFTPPQVQELFDEAILVVDKFCPDTNNSSYQPLRTSEGNIPARILAITLAGLILCEEANRGDRWFWRQIMKAEQNTVFLGGAMPIAYFAALSFPWGLEIGKAADKLIPTTKR